MFDSFHVGLAVCSPVDYIEDFLCQKENTLWFSTIRSLPHLGGLVGNSSVHQFYTGTDFCLNNFKLFSWHDCIY